LEGKKCIVLARLIFTQFAAMKLLKGKRLDKINHLHKSGLNQRTKAIKKSHCPAVPHVPESPSLPYFREGTLGSEAFIIKGKEYCCFVDLLKLVDLILMVLIDQGSLVVFIVLVVASNLIIELCCYIELLSVILSYRNSRS
jgi:hypothetical protein